MESRILSQQHLDAFARYLLREEKSQATVVNWSGLYGTHNLGQFSLLLRRLFVAEKSEKFGGSGICYAEC